ncbi:endonuclease/exonuclease/phosphatase family protein, partial [Trifolium medium]|nr:endonuclease/exonuclease/phosphatase family protein [Trifolium medium]
METYDGLRDWGPDIRADFKRGKGGSTSRWLREDGSQTAPQAASQSTNPNRAGNVNMHSTNSSNNNRAINANNSIVTATHTHANNVAGECIRHNPGTVVSAATVTARGQHIMRHKINSINIEGMEIEDHDDEEGEVSLISRKWHRNNKILQDSNTAISNLRAVSALKYLVRCHKPVALFLSETLVHYNKIEDVRRKLGFDNCFAADREGRGGGLAFLWNNTFNCEIQSYSPNFINILVNDSEAGRWRLTGFYGLPHISDRRKSWDMLRSLAAMSHEPWCIIVIDAGLSDIVMEGYPYTWSMRLGTVT